MYSCLLCCAPDCVFVLDTGRTRVSNATCQCKGIWRTAEVLESGTSHHLGLAPNKGNVKRAGLHLVFPCLEVLWVLRLSGTSERPPPDCPPADRHCFDSLPTRCDQTAATEPATESCDRREVTAATGRSLRLRFPPETGPLRLRNLPACRPRVDLVVPVRL